MKKKDNSTLIFLALAGLGLWWWFNKKSTTDVVSTNPVAPVVVLPEQGQISVNNLPPATPYTSVDGATSNVNSVIADSNLIRVKYAISGTRKRFGQIPNTI